MSVSISGIEQVHEVGAGGAIPVTIVGPVSTKSPLTASPPQAILVGVVSTLILAANPSRKSARIINVSNSRIALAFGAPAVLDTGMILFPGGIFNMDEYDFNLSVINGIASQDASSVGVQEFT